MRPHIQKIHAICSILGIQDIGQKYYSQHHHLSFTDNNTRQGYTHVFGHEGGGTTSCSEKS